MDTDNRLARLLSPAEYQPTAPQVFPTLNSLDWFMRQNMSELTKLGAVVTPTGRKLINPEEMDRAVLAIGKRRACRG